MMGVKAPPPFGYYAPPEAGGGSLPVVIVLFRIYAGLLAVAGAFVTCMMIATVRSGEADNVGRDVVYLFGLIGAVAALVHGIAAFVPRRPWAWTYGTVVLALGIPSCTIALAIPLLVFWLRPECKAAFRRFL